MRIDSLEVKGFGKLTSRSVNLKKGLNILYGSNEAGKTTLQWFIKGMLYGLKGYGQSRTGWMQPRKRYAPWGGGQYGGALVYTLDNGTVLRVERDFEKDTLKLFDNFFNDISGQFEIGRDKQPAFAEKQLGLDEAAFDRTVLIKQLEVRLDEDSSASLAGKLANAGSSGFDDISFSRAEKALMDALKNNVGTGRTTTQPLDRLETRLRQLNAEHDRLLKQKEQWNSIQADLLKARNERNRLEAENKYLEHVWELIEIRKALDLNLKQEAGLKEAVLRLKELEGVMENTVRHAVSGGPAAVHARRRRFLPLFNLTPVALFAILIGYFALINKAIPYWLFLLICGLGVLTTGIAALLAVRKSSSADARLGGKPTDDPSATGMYVDGVDARLEVTSQIRNICSSSSLLCGKRMEDPAAVRRELKDTAIRLDKLSNRLETAIEAASELGGGVVGFFNPKGLDMIIYDSSIESLEEAGRVEMENIRKKLLDASLREKYCEGLLGDNRGDRDELQCVEEETVAVMEKIAYLKHRGDALKLAREVLTEAGLEIRRTVAPGLDSSMSAIITGLTAGRYADLRGDDRLSLKVAVPESGDIKNALALSGAAADQMYLALRLALAGVLTAGGESLPLLMDEVFSQFDDDRTALAIKYLNNAYEKGQVLIFTCKKREVELAQEICGDNLNLVEL